MLFYKDTIPKLEQMSKGDKDTRYPIKDTIIHRGKSVDKICLFDIANRHIKQISINESIELRKEESFINGEVEVYDIWISDLRVYERQVVAIRIAEDSELKVVIKYPEGWWWNYLLDQKGFIPALEVCKMVLIFERSKGSKEVEITAKLMDTVILPDFQGKVAHVVGLSSGPTPLALYFVNVIDGSFIMDRRCDY